MFDAAFANLATAFSNMAGAPFVDAVASWPGTPTYDGGGSIVTPGNPVTYPCKAQFDAPTQQMREAEGFLQTDVRILVLASSLTRPLDTGATITARGETWALLSCQRDPAGVGFECAARKVA